MKYNWLRKEDSDTLKMVEKNTVVYFQFPLFEETGLVRHGFSTKLGGVSEGALASMNLSFSRGDKKENVLENYRLLSEVIEQPMEQMVLSSQTHTINVKTVTQKDAGKGLLQEQDYQDIDGFVTNIPGIMLVTFYADCVPLYFLDPVQKAIGLSHSGWRGTVQKMALVTIDKMVREYNSNPEDLLVCIGPSICKNCYEVSEDVASEFKQIFNSEALSSILEDHKNGKYQLDLWEANEQILIAAGVKKQNIAVTNTCTCCNSGLFYSHRKVGSKRGNLAAFLALK